MYNKIDVAKEMKKKNCERNEKINKYNFIKENLGQATEAR